MVKKTAIILTKGWSSGKGRYAKICSGGKVAELEDGLSRPPRHRRRNDAGVGHVAVYFSGVKPEGFDLSIGADLKKTVPLKEKFDGKRAVPRDSK